MTMNASASKTVLLLPSWYLPEGGEFVREQAIQLVRQGIDARILAGVELPWKKYPLKALFHSWHDKEYKDDGVLIYRRFLRRIPMTFRDADKMEEANLQRWTKDILQLFARYCHKHGKPALIHAHSSIWAGYVAAQIKAQYGIPYVLTEHRGIFAQQSDLAIRSFRPFYTFYLEKAFSEADYIFAPSEQMLPKIHSYLRQPVSDEVCSNIVDTDFFSLPQPSRSRNSTFRFIAINSYRDVKGYDLLLPAFDRVCEQDADVELVILGDGFNHPDFQRLLQTCRHRDKLRFTGFLEPAGVRAELWKSNAFVLSSRVEAQCISVLEALSTGIPVVCTEAVPEYTVPPSTGIRVPVEDMQKLATAMLRMKRSFTAYTPAMLHEHAERIASRRQVIARLQRLYGQYL